MLLRTSSHTRLKSVTSVCRDLFKPDMLSRASLCASPTTCNMVDQVSELNDRFIKHWLAGHDPGLMVSTPFSAARLDVVQVSMTVKTSSQELLRAIQTGPLWKTCGCQTKQTFDTNEQTYPAKLWYERACTCHDKDLACMQQFSWKC